MIISVKFYEQSNSTELKHRILISQSPFKSIDLEEK